MIKEKNYGYIRLSRRDEKALELLKKAYENERIRQEQKKRMELIKTIKEFLEKH
ncbi:hypothetical protein [uncultured Eudoraea sp.]|uniref:hypothetical protein n=1 Tax=uncultured Eudoraea sp. TaxID=1035614 RepID=UPI0026190BCE|nr:hypothetical protein [uncultured Eudoraea sp.]